MIHFGYESMADKCNNTRRPFAVIVITRGNEAFLVPVFTVAALWSYRDAQRIQVQKYRTRWPSPGSSPAKIALMVGLLFVVAFPMYIAYRERVLAGEVPLR